MVDHRIMDEGWFIELPPKPCSITSRIEFFHALIQVIPHLIALWVNYIFFLTMGIHFFMLLADLMGNRAIKSRYYYYY